MMGMMMMRLKSHFLKRCQLSERLKISTFQKHLYLPNSQIINMLRKIRKGMNTFNMYVFLFYDYIKRIVTFFRIQHIDPVFKRPLFFLHTLLILRLRYFLSLQKSGKQALFLFYLLLALKLSSDAYTFLVVKNMVHFCT